jgi:hypothetical protein
MNDVDIIENLRGEAFRARGIKLSRDDPIFEIIFLSRAMQEQFSAPIVEAIENLPALLEKSLEKIVVAVEEAERTSESLQLETKSTIAALAKLELEAAHKNAKATLEACMEGAVSSALSQVKANVEDLERRTKTIATGSHDRRFVVACTALSVLSLTLTVLFSAGLYALYGAGVENRKAADYWYSQYQDAAAGKGGGAAKRGVTPSGPSK